MDALLKLLDCYKTFPERKDFCQKRSDKSPLGTFVSFVKCQKNILKLPFLLGLLSERLTKVILLPRKGVILEC